MMTTEERLKHLDFVQAVINRLAQNSFLLKGWSVTLAAALFALAQSNTNVTMAALAFGPVLVMWGLDGYFLALERRFRALFKDAASGNIPERFSMEVTQYEAKATWWGSVTSKSVLGFHIPLVAIIALVVGYMVFAGGGGGA